MSVALNTLGGRAALSVLVDGVCECVCRWRTVEGVEGGGSRLETQVDISLEQTRHLPTIRKTFTSSVPGNALSLSLSLLFLSSLSVSLVLALSRYDATPSRSDAAADGVEGAPPSASLQRTRSFHPSPPLPPREITSERELKSH